MRRIIVAANKALAERLNKLREPQGGRTLKDLLAEVRKMNRTGTGQPIVNKGMEGKQADYQYTGNTTLAARGLSTAINAPMRLLAPGMSVPGTAPVQLDYLTNAYFGWLGSIVMMSADQIVRGGINAMRSQGLPFAPIPTQPSWDYVASLTGHMVQTQPSAASRYIDLLYTQGQIIEQAYATWRGMLNTGQQGAAADYLESHRGLIQQQPRRRRGRTFGGDLRSAV